MPWNDRERLTDGQHRVVVERNGVIMGNPKGMECANEQAAKDMAKLYRCARFGIEATIIYP